MRLRSLCPCGHLKHGESFLLKAFASTYKSRHCSAGISSRLDLQRTNESRSMVCRDCCWSFTFEPPSVLIPTKRQGHIIDFFQKKSKGVTGFL
jgi:transcription elongation factor Elf1